MDSTVKIKDIAAQKHGAAGAGQLTATMQRCVDFANKNGGKLYRYPGGFWTYGPEYGSYLTARTFGTPTVQALVTRGVAEYTKWVDGRNGKFPVMASIRSGDSEQRFTASGGPTKAQAE